MLWHKINRPNLLLKPLKAERNYCLAYDFMGLSNRIINQFLGCRLLTIESETILYSRTKTFHEQYIKIVKNGHKVVCTLSKTVSIHVICLFTLEKSESICFLSSESPMMSFATKLWTLNANFDSSASSFGSVFRVENFIIA